MRVINLKSTTETDYNYIGRANSSYGVRKSPLANPYRASQFGRAEAIAMYRRWLWEMIEQEDRDVLYALSQLDEDTVLACWCKPKACHGDVVIAAWYWLKANRSELLKQKPVRG